MARKPPKYRHHKARDLAKVTINGCEIYLGKHNSTQSWERYAEVLRCWNTGGDVQALVARWNGQSVTSDENVDSFSSFINVGELTKRFWSQHARDYYQSSTGNSRGRTARVKLALRALNDSCRQLPAERFGPLAFQQVRQSLVDRGLSRRYVMI